MSLLDAADRLASIDRSQVVLDPNRCLNTLDRFADCHLCDDICPEQAISVGESRAVDPKACKVCYACLPVCPAGAFQADDDVSSLLTCATHVESKSIELLCGYHPQPSQGDDPDRTGIQIQGCLAGLGVGALSALYALGITQVFLRTDACASCPWSKLHPLIHSQAQLANRFLAGWGTSLAAECIEEIKVGVDRLVLSAKNPPLSRRDLFRMFGRQGKLAVARAMDSAPGEHGQHLGRDRLRLLAAVSNLPAPEFPADIRLDGLRFAVLEISEACDACGVCARTCPTEALRFSIDEEKTRYEISLEACKCTGCEVCVHVCAPAAIQVDHAPAFSQVFTDQPVILQQGELARCADCGARFAKRAGNKLCSLCEYRRKNPFAATMPPGWMKVKPNKGD